MFVKLRNALKGLSRPAPQTSRATQEDPFESIKKALSSVSDHFNKLGDEFEPVEKLNVDPKALPAKKRTRKTATVVDVPKPETSKAPVKAPAKAASKPVAKAAATKKPVASKPVAKPAATKTPAPETTPAKVAPKKPAAKTSTAKTAAPKTASPKPVSEKPVAKKPATK